MSLLVTNIGSGEKGKVWSSFYLRPVNDEAIERPMHAVTEDDQIKFELDLDFKIRAARIIVDGVTLEAETYHVGAAQQETKCLWMPKKKPGSHHYQAFFFNYFGIAQLAVEVDLDDGATSTFVLEPLEVQGRKVTAERAVKMLQFITDAATEEVLDELSPTSYNATEAKVGAQSTDILNKLEKTLKSLQDNLRSIAGAPLRRLRTEELRITYPRADDIDEDGLNWIMENPWVLSESPSVEEALLEFNNCHYLASEVRSRRATYTTDTYENRFVHFCLNKIQSEAIKVKESALQRISENSSPLPVRDGFVSFYEMRAQSVSTASYSYVSRLDNVITALDRLRFVAAKYLPVKTADIERLQVTEQIKANRHYLSVFKCLREWLEQRSISWEKSVTLAKVTNLPKIFEYYTALVLDRELRLIGTADPDSRGLFKGTISDERCVLRYEPDYWKPNHVNGKGHAVISVDQPELRHAISDQRRPKEKTRVGNKLRRTPDLSVEWLNDSGAINKLMIFDAKCWTNESKMYAEELPRVAMKYGYGLRSSTGKMLSTSVILFNPAPEYLGSEAPLNFHDFHASPVNLYSDTPALPVLGTQRFRLSDAGDEPGLSEIMRRLVVI